MLRLFTSHDPEKCATRLGDLQACLKCNIGNSVVDLVCLLLEGVETPCPTEVRLQVRAISNGPRYQDPSESVDYCARLQKILSFTNRFSLW
jgi:hypothetical protein